MHKEILSKNQIDLIPLVKQFSNEYFLVGGTAIALYLGHRRSIDFDLFKHGAVNHKKILKVIDQYSFTYNVARKVVDQFDIVVHGVKLTFMDYPFKIESKNMFEGNINLPALIDLAAMKAYAIGRRSKWKDYVDLYFLLKDHFSIDDISKRALSVFGQLFSEKQFRAQLCFFDDIDYTESVDFIMTEVSNSVIHDFLIYKATEVNL